MPVSCADGAVLPGLRHHALPQRPFAGQLAGCPAQQCRHSSAGALFCLAGLGGGAQLPCQRQRAADKAAECCRVRGHCSAGGLWRCAKSAGLLVFAPACLTVITEKKTANDVSFYKGKEGRKLIAVELAPPLGIDDEKIMDAAFLMKESGVDVLTFPDSPSGRTRADSILMAEKVSRETGMCVMPHICCRDKNAIAMRSQLLGAHINDINNFLVITGDPIPSVVRASVKSVFNFDSVGLMNIISDMNQEQFAGEPVIYGGAINQGRVNFKVELERVKKKMEAGATFFMTQPVFSDEDIDRLRQIKEQTGARILCGIMPFVSLRNATFMKNEMTGINVTDEILSRYRADMSKEEGEETGIQIAREIIAKTTDFVDGYYFSFPFNRVHMLKKIIGKNNQ